MNNLDYFKDALNSVGWFIPPYVSIGYLSQISGSIVSKGESFTQSDLENYLKEIYSPLNLGARFTERYSVVPFIKEYKDIIGESVEAHFFGLNHVAVSGLLPVIEGAGKKIAKNRGVKHRSIKELFLNLAEDCKEESINRNVGAVGEIASMMDSFIEYSGSYLYLDSTKYIQMDKTNRHGILHGAYTDSDYGLLINFYKIIAAIDFLCFVVSFRENISWLSPEVTESSIEVSRYYVSCLEFSKSRKVKRME